MRTLARLFVVPLFLAPALSAAAQPAGLKILATVLPLREFAAAVAGNRAEVRLLLPPGAGVHDWQPRPGDIGRLAECDLLLFIGSGLEPWLPSLLKALPPGRPKTFEAAATLSLRESDGEEGGEAAHDHGPLDPHVWLDFELDVRIAERIADELGRLDPAGASVYAANAAKLAARLAALDQEFRVGLAGCRGKVLVLAGHNAFGYLARRYGLVQRALYGLSPDAQPKPRDIMAAVDYCRKNGVRTVFSESSVPPGLAETLARETG